MMTISLSACGDTDDTNSSKVTSQPENIGSDNEDDDSKENMKLKITIDSAVFTATLQNNMATNAFKKLLPMTINMAEHAGNEKYYNLPNSLPTNLYNPEAIQNGDIMLFGSQTLVLFYKSFSTSYNYTLLGKIDDTAGLASALGFGSVTVIFEVE